MKKRVLSWLLAAVMLLSMLPVTALAEGTGTDVHVTLVDQTGEIVVAYEAVTAEDQNANGTMDIDDVLYAAHETFYEGGAAAGYSTSDGGYGLSISMLWGDTSGSYGYYVNNASAWSLLDEVSAGSHVVAFVYQDTAGWSDVYSYFDRDTAEVETGEALELNLSYQYWDFDMADYGSAAVSGAVITVDGEAQDVTTDENGNAVLTFDTAGTYLVSAFSDAQLLVPPVCMVTVGEAEPEVQPTTIYTGSSKPHSVFGYVSSITVHDVQVEEYLWVGDTAYVTLAPETADDAAARITFTTGGSRAPSMPDTSVTLSGGRAEQSFSASASIFGTWNFTIRLSNQGFPPVLADGVLAETEVTAYVDDPYTLDLSTIFTDETGKTLTYYVQEDGGSYTQLSGSVYTMTPGETGTRTLTFKASNGLDSETYTVHMTVKEMTYYDMTVQVPENISPVFYGTEGYNADGVDVPGDALTAAGSAAVEGLCTYTVTVPEKYDTISVRADGWGGMSVEAGAGSTVTLRRMEGTLAADVTGEEIDGTVQVTYDGHTAEAGEGSRYLLAVGKSYTYTAAGYDTATYKSAAKTETLEAGVDVAAVELRLAYQNQKTITVTTGAVAQLFKMNNYYSYTEIEPKAQVDNGDGTTTFYYVGSVSRSPYRVSMEGKVTKAGYWSSGNDMTVLHTDEDPAEDIRPDYAAAGTAGSTVAEDNVLLNVNGQNHLQLSVGDTKTLKGYRAWEIIMYSFENRILTPDFHYTILSGEDVVSLAEMDSPSTGTGDWVTLTALQEGTAVIEATYDAISVSGSAFDGIYGASDPARTGLVVVTVGESAVDVDFGIDCRASMGSVIYKEENAKDWDAEFDTLYFTGDSGTLRFSPTSASGTITEVAVSNDKGDTWTVLAAEEGVYTADIVSGNNILRVTTETGTAYQVVRGDKLEVVLTNQTAPGQPFAAGDTVRVTLHGLHMPIPKMSGNYNPGYGGNTDGYSSAHLSFTFNGETVNGKGQQYTFASAGNYVDVTLPADSEASSFTLSDGYIGVGVIGLTTFADGGDSHRNIPDSGCSTRGSSTTFNTRSMLPEVTIAIGGLPTDNTAPYIRENAAETATISLGKTYAINLATIFADREGDALTYKMGEDPVETYYKLTPEAEGTYTLTFTANDGQVDSKPHTITLTVTDAVSSGTSGSLDFGLSESESDGRVYVSFEDKGKRVEGDEGTYPEALGTIIKRTAVPYTEGDTIADVTLRLLDAYGFAYDYSGSTKTDFYLASIGSFTVNGVDYEWFGEFDAGAGSGWMITHNGAFIGQGASAFTVENGDIIKWQYTCQLGADIGDPYYEGTGSKEEVQTEETVSGQLPFTDIGETYWARDAVEYVYTNGLMNGTAAATFSPELTTTRGMIVTILHRLEKEPAAKAAAAFPDVAEDSYCAAAVAWAAENGIVNGYIDGSFGPNDVITREQMAAILYRYAQYKGQDVSVGEDTNILSYEDAMTISGYAVPAIQWACGEGILTGKSGGILDPKGGATRAQAAVILMRYLETAAK